MKAVLIAALLGVMSFNSQGVELSTDVVGEVTTYVGFAPREYRGIFRFQLLSSGNLQAVDNHGVVKALGSVSKEIVADFQKKIESIQSDELVVPTEPLCSDAPSTHITVQRADGTDLIVFKRGGCRDSLAKDEAARHVAQALNNLEDAFRSLSYHLN